MKGKTANFIMLIIGIALMLLFHYFYDDILSLIGISISGGLSKLVEYLVLTGIVFAIYFKSIKSGKNRYDKSFFTSVLYSVVCLVFLVVVTILVHEFMNNIGKPIPYSFTNYFQMTMTMDVLYKIIEEVILMPFLLVMIFPLGFSQSFKSGIVASVLAGLSYGIVYGLINNLSIDAMLTNCITPALIIMFLTGLYRNIKNIWTVYITYACYILFGIFILGYIK